MLSAFSKKLKAILYQQPRSRPFVCDGDPRACKIFIVGYNAATEMQHSFWDFWTDDQGFDKKKWLEAYLKERQDQIVSAGKKRRNKISNTRQRLDWLEAELSPLGALETNIYFIPTSAAKDLRKEDQQTQGFRFLLQELNPQLLFIHGKKVWQALEQLSGITLEQGKPNPCELFGRKLIIWPEKHLSRGWSQEGTRETGSRIKTFLEEQSPA